MLHRMTRDRREIIMIIVIMKKEKERRVDRGIEKENEVDQEKIISIVKVIRRVESMIIIRIRVKNPEEIAADQQARFQAMRERLLNQDPRVD